jgi:hypothetical protein
VDFHPGNSISARREFSLSQNLGGTFSWPWISGGVSHVETAKLADHLREADLSKAGRSRKLFSRLLLIRMD